MNQERSLRRLLGALLTAGAMYGAPARMSGQGASSSATSDDQSLQLAEWRVMDVLVQTYGDTDWASVAAYMVANAGDAGNPNIVFIPLSLGNAHLNRYEWANHTADFERAVEWEEWVAGNHWLWGHRWLSAPVVSYLDLSVLRLEAHMELPEFRDRIAQLRDRALQITEEEADARLTGGFPYLPYDSSTTGDSKAEENAWEASLLAAAANFLPDHEHASQWDAKARQLAYDAITCPSDPPDSAGVKTVTVTEDLALNNHGFFPNPTYAAATLLLLAQGALMYRMSGRPIPAEFEHNVQGLYRAYGQYVGEDLSWKIPSDPSGNATLFPFAFDPELEQKAVARRLETGSLWVDTPAVEKMEIGSTLWAAVLNSKTVLFYMVGSYLWHFPPADTSAWVEPAN